MLNERDEKIIRYIENYGFVTISQCYKMFFRNRAYGYDLARKRLAKLQQKGHLLSQIDYLEKNPEKIYYIDEEYSSPSKHTIMIMNSLAEIYKLDANVRYFAREQEWLDGKRRSDAYMIFNLNNYVYQLFVEVEGQTTKKKKSRAEIVEDFNKKYTDILRSEEPLKLAYKCFDLTPENYDKLTILTRILVIDNFSHNNAPWYVDDEKVIQVDFSLKQFGQILI